MHGSELLLGISAVCLFFATFGGLYEPVRPFSGSIGWAGLFFFVLSILVK